jgi:hypothetical protein
MISLLLMTLLGLQDPHRTLNNRGAMAMGFDQETTAHHFHLFDDGGAIEVAVRDVSNVKDREAIRSHLPHIATMFQAGEFEVPMLVHDSNNVPGVDVLSKRKDSISYTYAETPRGGSVEITTDDPQALKALHAFLAYQIREHRTGDPTIVTKRK